MLSYLIFKLTAIICIDSYLNLVYKACWFV